MKIFAVVSVLMLVACGSGHDCAREPDISLQRVRSALHLPPSAAVDAESMSATEIRNEKPQLFLNIPDGCYWRVTFRARISPSQERTGTALFRGGDDAVFSESATIVKYY